MTDRKSERDERLARALRENLKRRKAHARELAEQPESKSDGDPYCDEQV